MAFADPQSITIDGTAISLPRTDFDPAGVFTSTDGTVELRVWHQRTKAGRIRRYYKVTHNKLAADPYVAGVNKPVNMSIQLTVDVPPQGYLVADSKKIIESALAVLTASTGAKLTQFLGGEA